MKNKIIIISGAILIVVSILFYVNTLKYETTDDAYIESNMVSISSRVSGQIEEVYITDNQKIESGDMIAKIDDSDYKILLEHAQAQYDKALYSQRGAKAKLQAAEAGVAAVQRDLDRYKNLYESGAVSQQTLDLAQAKYNSEKANLTIAQENVVTGSNNKVADANLKALKAQRDIAKLHLDYTDIKAPISGTVTNKNLDKGKFVQAGQPLLTIVGDDIWIEANFKENQVGKMKIGQDVEIRIDAFPKKKFKGKIDSIQKSTGAKSSLFPPENAVGSFVKIVQRIPVKIIFTEKIDLEEYNIVTGMSVEPKVRIK